jgi:DNA polymerase-3 subunit delta'
MVRDSIDGALLDIASLYRDVMMVQSGNVDSIINADMREQIECYAAKSSPHSTINKFGATLEARTSIMRNASPLITCESLFCSLARE